MAIATPSKESVLGSSIALPLLCLILVVLRLYSKYLNRMRPGIDDWLCLVALMLLMGMAASLIAGVALRAIGYPIPWDTRLPDRYPIAFIRTMKVELALELMQTAQLGAVKLSFIVLFRAIFATGRRSAFSITAWIMIVLISAWTVAFALGFLFANHGHISGWWNSNMPAGPGGCRLVKAFASSDFVLDLVIISMPVPMIYKLKMTTSRKVAVIGVFSLGALAVISSLIRLFLFYHTTAEIAKLELRRYRNIDNDSSMCESLPIDVSLHISDMIQWIWNKGRCESGMVWSLIESSLALMAACLIPIYGSLGKQSVETVAKFVQSVRSRTLSGQSDSSCKELHQQDSGMHTVNSSNSSAPFVIMHPEAVSIGTNSTRAWNENTVSSPSREADSLSKKLAMQTEIV